MTGMGLGIKRIRQLKLPVSDLEASARWYAALFGLENAARPSSSSRTCYGAWSSPITKPAL